MPNFVIEFNRKTRDRRVTQFEGTREAMLHRLELEGQRTDANLEIVALTSDSLEVLMQTHSRYFTGNELVAS
ncbi:hypothetical protein ACFRFQ_09915 [Rhodococcus sp. NPDC056743]|uniref:hypothetical protein n=1 Tax=Rhodococcus sp. NPDC056743 TaxID=3345934 RepID=UPI003671B8C2